MGRAVECDNFSTTWNGKTTGQLLSKVGHQENVLKFNARHLEIWKDPQIQGIGAEAEKEHVVTELLVVVPVGTQEH